MSRWSEAAYAELDRIYAQIPDIGCKGLCDDSCGPIDAGPAERLRLRQAGFKLPDPVVALWKLATTDPHYRCPALTSENRCGVFSVRPSICRIWGAVEDMRCPYGCVPADGEQILRRAEALALIDAANKAGTVEEPVTPEDVERGFRNNPAAADWWQNTLRQPTATRDVATERPGSRLPDCRQP